MPAPILYIDVSAIRPGHLTAIEALITDLVAFAEAHEPQLLSYGFFVDEPGRTMTCVALHPDAASLELHMDIGWEKFRAFTEHIEQRSIDVYGEASPSVIARLRHKIEMLGQGSVTIHRRHAGFIRLRTAGGTSGSQSH